MTLPLTLRVTERELRFFGRTWKGTVFTAFTAPVLLLLALGVGLGGLVGERPDLGGVPYLDFLTPGLLVAAAAQLAGGMSLWPIMAGHRWLGFHRAMIATPIGPRQVASGYLAWLLTRAVAQGALFALVAAALGGIGSWWGVLAPLVGGLTAAAFAAPLMAYTATCDSDRAFDPIMRILVTPLYLFSGSFFPTAQLPTVLELAVRLFPLWHGIELARRATASVDSTYPIGVHLAVLLAWSGAGLLVARRTFTQRLAP